MIKKLIWILLIIFPISNSFGAMYTLLQTTDVSSSGVVPGGIHFNPDGTKMFIVSQSKDGDFSLVDEYDLTTPFDISTQSYAGDSERCNLDNSSGGDSFGPNMNTTFGLEFSNDGMKLFVGTGGIANEVKRDRVFRFDLTSPYDVSTCSFANQTPGLDTDALQDGSNAGDREKFDNGNTHALQRFRLQGIEISNDGKKLFVIMHGHNTGGTVRNTRLLEYSLTTPFDLSSLSLISNAGIELEDEVMNPKDMRFSPDGKRLWLVDHQTSQRNVTQISLDVAFSTSTFTIDGSVTLDQEQPAGIAFSTNGLKMYVGGDTTQIVEEYNLVCPFNLFAGKCPPITDNSDRTGMALAQIEIAKRTIDHSTDSALNRLKWIRRNKDKQNLTNLNIDINFTNQRLASLTEIVKNVAAKKKAKVKEEDVFYWSEGSIAVGRIGDTSISSTKRIDTDAVTFGADKFTDENGIKGLAFRVGRNNVDIGNSGSNLDTDTFNITYYSTTPIEDDTKFLDTFIGVGGLRSDLLTVLDGKNLTANQKGKQIYGTIRIKDEIKKGNLTIIPSGRFDIGHTILGSYSEAGNGGIDVENQHIRTKKVRAGFVAVEDVLNEKYTLKRHGKIEYIVDLDRSSKFKYTYTGDRSVTFDDSLSSGALHSINSEIGIDIVLQDNFSVFLIYERNQALGSGHTDKIHLAIGYLPNKETNYAFNIKGSDDLRSEYILSKTINDFELDFKIINEDPFNISDIEQAFFNLRKVF